jgi:ribosomal protein S18 acetylase RimI-like enzyme
MTRPQTELTIREFRPGDESAFLKLNEEWITRYFAIEPREAELLADPQGTILERGGRIFLAVRDNQTIGCCALLAIAPGEFEVAKMTVAESFRGSGIGRSLLEKVIAEARALNAHRLDLETNSKLTPAIRLYESLGFRHLPPERIVPSPYARANVYMELFIESSHRAS